MTIPHTIDKILDELAEARSKREDAMAQRSIEHRAAGDRKQVARPGRAA
jgi:predicted transcriptional regulator